MGKDELAATSHENAYKREGKVRLGNHELSTFHTHVHTPNLIAVLLKFPVDALLIVYGVTPCYRRPRSFD